MVNMIYHQILIKKYFMSKEEVEKVIKQIEIQDQQNKQLIEKIKSVDAKDLENERYNNLSKKEKELLK